MQNIEYIIFDEQYKDKINAFSCGDDGLDNFIKEDIFSDDEDPEGKGTTTLVMIDNKMVGFYTVKNTSLLFKPDQHLRSIPAIEVIYLAVHKEHQCKGIGSAMLDSIIDKALNVSENFSEIRVVILSAVKDKVHFYINRGFNDLTNILEMPYSNCREVTQALLRVI